MSKHYPALAFTDDVMSVQRAYGSDTFYRRKVLAGKASAGPDPLTEDEHEFLRDRDTLYVATVSQTGWPYVQVRGGPKRFRPHTRRAHHRVGRLPGQPSVHQHRESDRR